MFNISEITIADAQSDLTYVLHMYYTVFQKQCVYRLSICCNFTDKVNSLSLLFSDNYDYIKEAQA